MKPKTLWAWGIALAAGLVSGPLYAHPLGNNTVNVQAVLEVNADEIVLRYLADYAEIPTLLAAQSADSNQDGMTSAPEWQAYTRSWAQAKRGDVQLSLDGQPLTLTLRSQQRALSEGAAGLSLLRQEARYSAYLPRGIRRGVLEYRDAQVQTQSGWKEIYLKQGGAVRLLSPTIATRDRSQGLRVFPAASELLNETSARAELEWLPISSSRTDQLVRAKQAAVPEKLNPAPKKLVTEKTEEKTEARPVAQTNLGTIATISADTPLAATSPAVPHSTWQQAWAFFRLGVYHIATGWDHLAFLLGLILLSPVRRRLIRVVTAFTLAHSLTLALASLGWVTPPSNIVEPAIALTVAYVGMLNVMRKGKQHGVVLAFGFGLVHGFGFAGALQASLAAGHAHAGKLVVSLASFNLGIEVFQILLILLVAPVLQALATFSWGSRARQFAALGVTGAGMGWFAVRALS